MVRLPSVGLAVAAASGLLQAVTAAPQASTTSFLGGLFDFLDVANLTVTHHNGRLYGCKCSPGQLCWPHQGKWNQLNATVGGNLKLHVPPAASCYNTFTGPLGTVNTYDAAACADVHANWEDEMWTVEKPGAALWTYFTNETCRPTLNPTDTCTLGYYGVYVITATTRNHIKAGIDFARRNNIRLVIRNTGHDFLGRSTGAGSLIINTHNFQDVQWISSYAGPGSYSGHAVTIAAGVQGRSILEQGHAQVPPKVIVTGECPTVGIAGGFIQGGGHGPWTTLKGLSADNVLAFEAITASGHFVTANEAQNSDLFWALKGGGPSAFAVILSVTMKTFDDVSSAGATFYVNNTHIGFDNDAYWNATSIFHKWSNHFVDNGLYVYFELLPFTLRAQPFVAIGKTVAELDAIVAPMLAELTAKGIPYEWNAKSFPTFFDLYVDLFEPEAAGGSALTGGWLFDHNDVATNNDGIIEAFKTVFSPRPDIFSFIVGHLFNPGHGAPISNSATHPSWRNATDFVITILPVPLGASKAVKADYQNVLTNTIDQALRDASGSGATYVNEADPYQPNWQGHFWGSEYPRLKQIRKRWDPLGVFYSIATPGTEDWERNLFPGCAMAHTKADERTPLLPSIDSLRGASPLNALPGSHEVPSRQGDADDVIHSKKDHIPSKRTWASLTFSNEKRILLAGFLITLSFSFTQVPILYAFHLMQCDHYYSTHPPYTGPGDRCSLDEIAAGMATQFSILAMSTTFCGTINLFVAGWTAKRIGPKYALMIQTLVPGIRVSMQILGLVAGGAEGMLIIQCTQAITVIGGPVGYLLIVNIIAGEVVSPLRRTAVFGMLQGCIMLGQGLGYLTGGMMGDTWGIRRPFEVAFGAFLLSALYIATVVPCIDATAINNGKKGHGHGISQLFAPLKVLLPQRVLSRNGTVRKHYGLLVLCAGIFLGVLATGYAPLLIQFYATAKFDFRQTENGQLTSGFAFMRGMFLMFAFPRIINGGRSWYMARHPEVQHDHSNEETSRSPHLATNPEDFEAPVGSLAAEQPVEAEPVKEDEGTEFDLYFLRMSLVVDGILTMCTALATKSWHIYLAALLLPLASGSAPAAKGVMTEMCSPSQRADALNALGLVENIALLATQGLFGFVFAALAEIGQPHLTFIVNATIAILAYFVLLFSRFPPEGSRIIEEDADENEARRAEGGCP
ncbi:6-hydroxy-D-nicotine oxidase [Triangularia verruculosa]|uniref:6-hydroxy-D-nicotine oxidase n=1 Tax=Triangularia verruculosa TaxID=2587418 RepID=A0AAN7AT34_9PEZI|nr:6-hydroxy-D-nicotine oxidase [Triangularia verruculosa]